MKQKTFPYESKYLEVQGTTIHYVDEGKGKPIIFLHGNPTSSYLWRNILPFLTPHARCIAPDLPGMGKSGKPGIDYKLHAHYQYIEAFIEKMGFRDITFVLHDWGSAIGFQYAMKHKDNIKGLVFLEAIIKPWRIKDLSWFYRIGFFILRKPVLGEIMVYGMNAFLNIVLPALTIRKLTAVEKKVYKAPYKKIKDRKPLLTWVRELPINGKPGNVCQLVDNYSQFLQDSRLPKLLLYGEPGAIINDRTVVWCRKNINNLTTAYVGKGYHFLQEDQPKQIGREISEWYNKHIEKL